MACKCPKRLRKTLLEAGYELKEGIWKLGDDRIQDAEIRAHHARITAMRPHLYKGAIKSVIQATLDIGA